MSREFDDFVARLLAPDPTDSPDLLLLSGYLGASSEEGRVRLYQDEELSRYVEIPEKAIRHAQALTPEQSPLGGSLAWIDRKAEVMHGKAGAEPGAASFLEAGLRTSTPRTPRPSAAAAARGGRARSTPRAAPAHRAESLRRCRASRRSSRGGYLAARPRILSTGSTIRTFSTGRRTRSSDAVSAVIPETYFLTPSGLLA